MEHAKSQDDVPKHPLVEVWTEVRRMRQELLVAEFAKQQEEEA